MLVLKRGESASSGTGTRISTLLAVDRRLNCARACKGQGRGNVSFKEHVRFPFPLTPSLFALTKLYLFFRGFFWATQGRGVQWGWEPLM